MQSSINRPKKQQKKGKAHHVLLRSSRKFLDEYCERAVKDVSTCFGTWAFGPLRAALGPTLEGAMAPEGEAQVQSASPAIHVLRIQPGS